MKVENTMRNTMVQRLIGYSHIHRSAVYRVVSFSIAICVFLVLMPIVFVLIGRLVHQWLTIPCPRGVELILAGISGPMGLLILLWPSWTQWTVGRGGPMINAPSQKLITSGPYALCRDPIQLGAFFYILAFGLFFGNLVVTLVCIILELIIGTAYHKGVEEKELLIRFGAEYQHYKEKIPFLIPRFRKR